MQRNPCVYFVKSKCPYGDECVYAHNLELMNSGHQLPKTVRLYKSELCKMFSETGICKFGDRCQFAHGKKELREVDRHKKYKTRKCKKFHEEGICPFGNRCAFIHGEEQRKSPQNLKNSKEKKSKDYESNFLSQLEFNSPKNKDEKNFFMYSPDELDFLDDQSNLSSFSKNVDLRLSISENESDDSSYKSDKNCFSPFSSALFIPSPKLEAQSPSRIW
jgi:hypothetical protein